MHGWGTNKGDALENTYFLHELGYNLLYFDFRCSGESLGNISTVGYLEVEDFKAAMEFLKKHKPEQSQSIGVYGISMGASVGSAGASVAPPPHAASKREARTNIVINRSNLRVFIFFS